ncbi:cupin domain-containing protein [candidate division KSB1 bacterium]|nr:cupin domain-containing protein [candidate division KSB1 bacterium]
MSNTKSNIFHELPESAKEEIIERLLATERVVIERIVSQGQSSPQGFWYDQDNDEWVIVLQGRASLRFETEAQLVKLVAGDYLLIPAHVRHRVEWTDPDVQTIWVAVHYK